MQPWQPASPFEEQLLAAYLAGDEGTCLGLLCTTEFALPISAAAAAGEEPPRWATAAREDRSWVIAYTSVESMLTSTSGEATNCRICTLLELAAGWPDPEWGLAVNPGLPVQLMLESGTVARLAAPPLAQQEVSSPYEPPPLVQKVVPHAELADMFASRNNRVSGYVHSLGDVVHIGSPKALVEALARAGDEDQLLDDDGSLLLLRWLAIGPELYRSPYGGTTEGACAAIEGWVIEERPFVGTGFVPNIDQVIREFKVDGIALPHGSEIVELDIQGAETRRAIWDGDRGTWLLAVLTSAEQDRSGGHELGDEG